jgi:DNA-binding MarR family transcriptional regulator
MEVGLDRKAGALAQRLKPADVGLRYLSVAHRVRKTVDDRMAAQNLSLARTKVLQVLDRSGAVHQAALATELGFAARSVTQAVEGLERDGLVRRTQHPGDRRAKLVTLTTAGTAALAAGTAAGAQALHQIFGGLDQKRLASLADLLAAVEASLADAAED